jgi:redox-sensing transcriptional repressor
LQVNQQWNVAVIGAGNLGSAISHYAGFTERGFRIAWLFDADPTKVGNQIGNFKVLSINEMEQIVKEHNCQIAMLAVPAEYAQDVADKLIKAGIRAILNYAPISINVPENVMVQYIDPVVHMQHMTYYLRDEE